MHLVSRHLTRFVVATLIAGLSIVSAGASRCAAAEPAANRPDADAKSLAVLEKLGKFFTHLKGFETRMIVHITTEVADQKFDIELVHRIVAERPNKFSLEVESDAGSGNTGMIKCDGKQLIVYLSFSNKYLVESAPMGWAEMLSHPLVQGIAGAGNSGMVTLAMMSPRPDEALLEKVKTMRYVGVEKVGQIDCHHLAATQDDMDWEMWIEVGERPLIHKFVPDLRKAFQRMAEQTGNADIANLKMSNEVLYTDWKLDPKLDPAVFTFTPPEGAKEVDSMIALLRGDESQEAGPRELLGRPAPDFTLDLLDGGKLQLSQHRGKEIVILDFWATWCGPCRQAMPIIEKVADRYRDKGVVLYAVNLQEEPETIRKALEDDQLNPTVALDTEGKVAAMFRANAIPQTVIVGKDGTVQAVHVGLLPDLETQLQRELDQLVAGEVLAEPVANDGDADEAGSSKKDPGAAESGE